MRKFWSFLAIYLILVLSVTFGGSAVVADNRLEALIESWEGQSISRVINAWGRGEVHISEQVAIVHTYQVPPNDAGSSFAPNLDWESDAEFCSVSFEFAAGYVVRGTVLAESESSACWRAFRQRQLL